MVHAQTQIRLYEWHSVNTQGFLISALASEQIIYLEKVDH